MHWYLALMTEADLDSVLEIEEASFSRPWGRLSFFNELVCPDAFSYAARYHRSMGDDPIGGYICFRLTYDEMHILKIAVAPQWRREGLARRLMEDSFILAKGNEAVKALLEVRRSNEAAVTFYHRLGFKVIGKRKNYYNETGEDALVMVKHLEETL